jgi:hypothetical protein
MIDDSRSSNVQFGEFSSTIYSNALPCLCFTIIYAATAAGGGGGLEVKAISSDIRYLLLTQQYYHALFTVTTKN